MFGTSGKGITLKWNDKLVTITQDAGLLSNFVNDILCIERKIWCATNNGISCIDYEIVNDSFEVVPIVGGNVGRAWFLALMRAT